jgi:hypothetical protein
MNIPKVDFLENKYFQTSVKLLLILYASTVAPRLPANAVSFMQSTIIRIVSLAAITYFSLQGDLQMSLLLACALVLSSNLLSGRSLLESYADIKSSFSGKKNPQQLLEPQFYIYPGCLNMKLADLLELFENDKDKLQETIHYVFKRLNQEPRSSADKTLVQYAHYAGLPHNVAFNDSNAPLIATMLMQYGYKLSDTCKAPE